MLNRGDAVVYKCRGLYKVEDIGTLDFSFADRQKKYYTLQSVEDERDRAYVPTDDESNIRKPVSREEALNLIDRIADIEVLKVKNEKLREQEYRDCIADYCPENWVKVLKTTYNRTKRRVLPVLTGNISCFLNMLCTVNFLLRLEFLRDR